jgi:hypothetical protein
LGGRDITEATLARIIEDTLAQDEPGGPILWPDLMKE